MKTQADESLPCGSKAPTMPCLTAQNMTSHCYAGVLRSVYDEIFVLDFARDQCRELYRSTNVFETPAINKGLTALLDDVSANYVHPDDRAAFIALFNPETLDRIDEKRGFVSADVRKKCTTGGYRWAQVMLFRLQPPNEAQPLFLVGVEDVEERKRAAVLQRENETLQQQKLDSLRYKAVVDHTRTLVFEWRGTELNYLSHRIPELLAGNYDGRIPFEVWREDGVLFAGDNAAMDACLSRLALGVKSGETTVRLRRRDGQFIWCKVTYTALADGEPGDRYIGTLNDVDAITRSEQALRQRAELDPLTGAYNTQTFFEKVESLLKKNPENPYAVLRFDVAGFKALNEAFGLEEGNRLLRVIARLVRQRLDPEREIFARLTADVFAACLTGDTDRLLRFMQSLSRRLEHY